MASYLVTGGCGFIGSQLVDSLLSDGHHVRVLDNLSTGSKEAISDKADLIVGDVTDGKTTRNAFSGIDGCFHLAAVAPQPSESQLFMTDSWTHSNKVNLTGSIKVFDAARKHKVPVVYASSAAVYGDNAENPLQERSIARPLTPYGADKLATELHARVATIAYGVPTIGLRFFNVYGPGQSPESPYSGAISNLVDHLISNIPFKIFGDGEQTCDFIYVGDAIKFLRAAMARNPLVPEVFNVCRGKPVSVNRLVWLLMSVSGRRLSVEYAQRRKGDILTSVGNPALAAKELGLVAEMPITDGLRALISSVESRLQPVSTG